ncbi:AbrB/MazE/SpoVT family DNA-binding domain-containing protein [Rhodohalobacter sp. 614A]|uniref:AbrB/MazE/SpoVT family DNA-binding domain-containing protein n=1 Tax=Rhodohalobacter sp. 614A TaxID=2908649 RepID=UPI001F215CDE|nr:AbrB/MazE/SpoVT family DNA-binding domain-containing protein [Rhodohalobacter sp. 614A]
MATATITSKGQVTIPKKIRDKLGLQAGDHLNFDIDSEGKIAIQPEKKDTDTAFGILQRDNQETLTIEEMDSGVAEYFKKKYKAE